MKALLSVLLVLSAVLCGSGRAAELAPFLASYEAWYQGRHAGDATMRVEQAGGGRWEVSLGIRGRHGFAGLARVNIEQSTQFDIAGGHYRPLRQETVRKALVFTRRATGSYDWNAREAQWSGDVSKRRRAPVPLRDGDMSALLINLAIMRDAKPGATLQYRYVDGGRARDHVYQVAPEPEIVEVGELSYNALRVSRIDEGRDAMIVWIADGVPTPVRILQLDDEGEDDVDLRLIEYQGVQ
ncbi:DUF3108 domain-containing protein [Luteimonas yindakuii]|uniref:DUF3108 domain-containing protein n=1 Tax=Luteimonas yindakuii TaxID=2565782 RepID=A0A4Z1RIH2_9GAMM|nr:DUF3108 domain-containing protein [Luteimonas yindakuii]TKS53441.1 DUF3108 domain-containing protein [Luteimonas yindakuii]